MCGWGLRSIKLFAVCSVISNIGGTAYSLPCLCSCRFFAITTTPKGYIETGTYYFKCFGTRAKGLWLRHPTSIDPGGDLLSPERACRETTAGRGEKCREPTSIHVKKAGPILSQSSIGPKPVQIRTSSLPDRSMFRPSENAISFAARPRGYGHSSSSSQLSASTTRSLKSTILGATSYRFVTLSRGT